MLTTTPGSVMTAINERRPPHSHCSTSMANTRRITAQRRGRGQHAVVDDEVCSRGRNDRSQSFDPAFTTRTVPSAFASSIAGTRSTARR